jgi:hypothetical protein
MPEQNAALPQLLTSDEAAKYLRIAEQTLAKWRCYNRLHLPFTKIGGRVVYRVADLIAFLELRTRKGESKPKRNRRRVK